MFPLDFETEEDFAALRELLASGNFDEPAICRRMEVPTIYHVRSLVEGRADKLELESKLDVLVRLFIDVEPVARSVLEEFLTPEEVGMLQRLRVVRAHGEDQWRAVAMIYPTQGLLITSDSDHPAEGYDDASLAEDIVYAANTTNTQHFMSSLPQSRCDRLLELCSGTGIAALAGAGAAEHAWALDIAERSSQCARFNARLNRIDNITVATGDLYEAIDGLTFDRIVAHPPYVAADELKLIFRDGGHDGEQITRRVIEGLPTYLAPGGRFHCTAVVTDRSDNPFESRVRELLGDSQGEFDILVMEMGTEHPTIQITKAAMDGRVTFEEVAHRHQVFSELEVTQQVYCSFVIQRRATARDVFTLRVQRGPLTTGREIEWMLDWQTSVYSAPKDLALLEEPFLVSPRIQLLVVHRPGESAWNAKEFTLGTETPFFYTLECPEWVAELAIRSDGVRTGHDHFAWLSESQLLAPDTDVLDFLRLLRSLVTAGYIQPASHPLPFEENESVQGETHAVVGAGK